MSEQDFALIEGNRYRGSRYSNFAGAGIDPQGNVSPAAAENASNVSNNRPYQDFNTAGIETNISAPAQGGQVSGGLVSGMKTMTPKTMAINAAVPYATTRIGSSVGANIAAGMGAEQGFKQGISAVANKASSGLIGTAAPSPTNTALAGMGPKFGPATPSAVSNVVRGANIGSAFGAGLGSAAATLLTGGTFKDAAKSGIGSGVGFYVGNMIVPGIGGIVGSMLGSLASGLFGSSTPRVTLGANIGAGPDGRLSLGKVNNKGADNQLSSKYGTQITDVLNRFADATGIKYKSGLSTETNIGTEDKKTAIWQNKNLKSVSGKSGDIGAVALSYLKNPNNYEMGSDAGFNSYLSESIGKAKSINDLVGLVGDRKASQGLVASQPARIGKDRKMSFYS